VKLEMVNGTELLDDPFNTVFSPFTDLLGSAFWLVPISIIAAALFMKTKSIVTVGAWLLGTGLFMTTGNIFSGFPMMSAFYVFVIVVGIALILVGLILERKGG